MLDDGSAQGIVIALWGCGRRGVGEECGNTAAGLKAVTQEAVGIRYLRSCGIDDDEHADDANEEPHATGERVGRGSL